MRTFTTAVLLLIAGLTEAGGAAAQTPPAPPPPAAATPPPPAPPPPAPAPPPPAPAAAEPPPPAAAAPAPAAAAPAAPAAPATPPGNWWDKFSGDAFVDAYGAVNWNFPRPQYGATVPYSTLREYDQARGFSLNWAGLDASYAADPIGATINLRFGPGIAIHNGPATPTGTADNNFGLEYVRQAYATAKFGGIFTLDAGKFDQPFGSEVPDSQLNMEYTRSLLYTENQPLFFTGLRLDIAPTATTDLKLIAANGWNNSIDDNSGKTFAAQFSIKPIDQLQLYIGWAGGPEEADITSAPTSGATPMADMRVPGADSHWRHLVDLVADFNPTSAWRFLLNADYDTEKDFAPGHSAIWYGANLAIRWVAADPFQVTVRGEILHDEHGDIVGINPTSGKTSADVESLTLTLQYVIATHYSLMLDNRVDIANSSIFETTNTNDKTQFTSTLGVIAHTN
jgi:hypothetical protein